MKILIKGREIPLPEIGDCLFTINPDYAIPRCLTIRRVEINERDIDLELENIRLHRKFFYSASEIGENLFLSRDEAMDHLRQLRRETS